MAKRRCLMVLSVLSGSLPVTEAITQAAISRATYYKLEAKALQAMLVALTPGSEETSPASGPSQRLVELEAKVTRLERDKRRAERLLFLTRQVLKPGKLTTAQGRRNQTSATSSPRSGKTSSPSSRPATRKSQETSTTKPSEEGPSSGSAS